MRIHDLSYHTLYKWVRTLTHERRRLQFLLHPFVYYRLCDDILVRLFRRDALLAYSCDSHSSCPYSYLWNDLYASRRYPDVHPGGVCLPISTPLFY